MKNHGLVRCKLTTSVITSEENKPCTIDQQQKTTSRKWYDSPPLASIFSLTFFDSLSSIQTSSSCRQHHNNHTLTVSKTHSRQHCAWRTLHLKLWRDTTSLRLKQGMYHHDTQDSSIDTHINRRFLLCSHYDDDDEKIEQAKNCC